MGLARRTCQLQGIEDAMGTCDPTFRPIGFRILVRPAQTDGFCKL